MLAFRSGQLAHKIKQFHEIYGDTVRVAPNEISFINPSCPPNALPKNPIRQPPPRPGQPVSILEAGDMNHVRIRKGYASSFSAQALKAQEPLLATVAVKPSAIVDLQTWISYCTFDIICSRYHAWVGLLVYSLKSKVQMAACRFYPWLFQLLLKTILASAQTQMQNHQEFTREKVQKRLNTSVNRPDFLSHLQQSKHELSEAEIVLNSSTLVLERVAKEICSSFTTAEDMDFKSLSQLPVLDAAIKEGIRLTSPVTLVLTRLIPDGGHTINGNTFLRGLERWLHPDQGAFINDRRNAVQPFLQGPRDCIGQNLARWKSSWNCEDQETYAVWVKPPSPVKLGTNSSTRT
ncbi:cytochrome P450 [Aspergillus terricola var. indicus]